MPTEWKAEALRPGHDAYLDWARRWGKDHVNVFGEGCWAPVLVRLNEGVTPTQFHDAAHADQAAGPAESGHDHDHPDTCLCLAQWYREGMGAEPGLRYLTALVSAAFPEKLAADPDLQAMVEQIVPGQRLNMEAINHEPAGGSQQGSSPGEQRPHSVAPAPQGSVVMGVIDDAIAFAHQRFRMAGGGTRVEYAWVQDLAQDSPYASRRVPYGREFSKPSIDGLLKAHTTQAGLVDEDGLYRAAGLIDFGRPAPKPLAWRLAHGTHVMDLACGQRPDKADSRRPIVCVQVPAAVTAETSGAGSAPYVLDGIWYILQKADEIAARRPGGGRLPVVINFSYGVIAGPHDGTHPIELAIDAIVEKRRKEHPDVPLAVVLPAGNSHLARCHAEVSFKRKAEEVILDWRILPDDSTSSYLEIWLPPSARGASRVEVAVAPPGEPFGEALADSNHGDGLIWQPNCHARCKLSYEYVAASGRGRFLVAVLPTAARDGNTQLAPAGLWRVRLTNRSLRPEEVVTLWIQRDDTPHGYPLRGRQSYFEEEDYERFDAQGRVLVEDNGKSKVRRAGSINAIATGSQPVVVGGLVRKKDGTKDPLARYSSGGPVTPPASGKGLHRQGPDAVAACDDSEVHWGVLAAGSRSGSVVAMNGTSVAAPRVARWIAEQFAASAAGGTGKAPTLGNPEGAVHARATGHAQPPGPVPQSSPPPAFVREGAGPLRLPPIVPLDRYEP